MLAHADDQGLVAPNQSQEKSLALSLGTIRVTLNHTLGRFTRLGWIDMRGHHIALRDGLSLRAVVEQAGDTLGRMFVIQRPKAVESDAKRSSPPQCESPGSRGY